MGESILKRIQREGRRMSYMSQRDRGDTAVPERLYLLYVLLLQQFFYEAALLHSQT